MAPQHLQMGLVYDWYQAKHAVSSIFAGYSLYDDKLEVSDFFYRRVARGFGLAFAGGSIDRVIRNLGCGGAAASVHCKARPRSSSRDFSGGTEWPRVEFQCLWTADDSVHRSRLEMDGS